MKKFARRKLAYLNGRIDIGMHKKLHEFSMTQKGTYGFPVEEHMAYWIERYDTQHGLLGVDKKEKTDKLTKGTSDQGPEASECNELGLGSEGAS